MRRRFERGFTVLELLAVIMIMSILARLSVPEFVGLRRDAIASNIAGDFNTIRAAAYSQFTATGEYPPETPAGVVPAGMPPYLPANFSFERPQYQLEWENWAVADTTGDGTTTGMVLAVTVITPDSLLGLQTLKVLGANCSHWSAGNAHTFVVLSTLESEP